MVALDADTGKTLRQFKTGSSVNATAITDTHRQYVTIAPGLGGLARRFATDRAHRRLDVDDVMWLAAAASIAAT